MGTKGKQVAVILVVTISFLACKRPEVALKEGPVAGIRYSQKGAPQNALTEDPIAGGTLLAEGLAVPLNTPSTPPLGRTLCVEIDTQRPNVYEGRGLATTWLIQVGVTSLLGAYFANGGGYAPPVHWSPETTAIGLSVGAAVGFTFGPVSFRANQAMVQEMGYLPWTFSGKWRVMEAKTKGPAVEIAEGPLPYLDLSPFMKPLPPQEAKDPAKVRQACLLAYEAALLHHLAKQGVPVAKAPTPRPVVKFRTAIPPAAPPTVPAPAS